MESFQPIDEFVINDLETLKAIVDPLRGQILDVLVRGPLTVKQIAERLGLAASKLYYHVNMLEKYGFIQVVETRMVANMAEKYYQATAYSYRVDHALLAFQTDEGKENINAVLTSVLNTTRDDILRSLEARTLEIEQGSPENLRTLILSRHLSRLPETRAEEFRARLLALLEEFDTADEEGTAVPTQPYALTVAFYPSIYFPDA